MILTKRKENIVLVLTFALMFCSVGYYCKNIFQESINTLLCSIFIFCMVTLLNRMVNISKRMLIVFFSMSGISLCSSILAGDSVVLMLYPIINLFLAMLYASCISFELFKRVWIRITTFVTFLNIVCGLLYYMSPKIFSIFPVTTNTAGNGVYNLFLLVMPMSGNFRLQGFAWEAGVFQLFINIALFFLILENKWTSENKKRLIILSIGLIMTFSTTGYIVGLINVLLFFMRDYNGTVSKLEKIIIATVLVFIALCIVVPLLPTTINGVSFGMAKIERFLQGVSTSNSVDSASVRFDSIYYPLQLFIEHPLIGAGYSGLESLGLVMRHTMVTCTIVNYFAMYGVIYGIIVIILYCKFARKLTRYCSIACLIVGGLLLVSFSEQLVNYILMDIILFMSMSSEQKNYLLTENIN